MNLAPLLMTELTLGRVQGKGLRALRKNQAALEDGTPALAQISSEWLWVKGMGVSD